MLQSSTGFTAIILDQKIVLILYFDSAIAKLLDLTTTDHNRLTAS